MLGKVASAIGEADGTIGAIDLVEVGERLVRDITVDAHDADHWDQILKAIESIEGAHVLDYTDRTFLMHVGGKIEHAQQDAAEDARRPLDGLHAGRRARLHGDRRRPREGLPVHDQAQHGRRRQRRDRGARARRHRPARRDAGHGGQGDALQGVRRRRRLPDLPRHQGPRRDRRDGAADRAGLRRHQPRGHLRAALLRDRGPAQGPSSTSPSSTTTSTAPRSSCSPRCSTPAS